MIVPPARVVVTRSTHHLYVELLDCYTKDHREAVDRLKTVGARWQPRSKRWELGANRVEVLCRWLDRFAQPEVVHWTVEEGR